MGYDLDEFEEWLGPDPNCDIYVRNAIKAFREDKEISKKEHTVNELINNIKSLKDTYRKISIHEDVILSNLNHVGGIKLIGKQLVIQFLDEE